MIGWLSGVVVDTASQAGGTLTIRFDSHATHERVNEVLSSLAYANTQDQFAPGSRKRAGVAGVSCRGCFIRPVNEPIGHIFDLVVRTYDRTSGKLLWEDSFEQLERIEEPAIVPETNAYPQAIPFWNSYGVSETEVYETALR